MAGPSEQRWRDPRGSHRRQREPAVAGLFYPADPRACREAAASYLRRMEAVVERPWLGGLVPHAGWVCSGELAGQTVATIAAGPVPAVVVVFGAVHTPIDLSFAALDGHRAWRAPTGVSEVPLELQEKLIASSSLFQVDERFHLQEHAVEVELPLIQLTWPEARILPVEVPANASAVEIGRQVARQIQASGLSAVFLASSDLTHYGPSYRFTPAGVGPQGLEWAMNNDRRLLSLVEQLAADAVVPESLANRNACGGGAIAAMLSACRELGATEARLLRHANSCQKLRRVAPQPETDAVGYAALVVG